MKFFGGDCSLIGWLRKIIDTLEVKEVDLGKELDVYFAQFKGLEKSYWNWRIDRINIHAQGIYNFAKHFFELGLKAQKVQDLIKIGETKIYLEDDGGEPPYDGKQWLDLSCIEYEIPEDKFKDGDNVEIIIRKKQKGE